MEMDSNESSNKKGEQQIEEESIFNLRSEFHCRGHKRLQATMKQTGMKIFRGTFSNLESTFSSACHVNHCRQCEIDFNPICKTFILSKVKGKLWKHMGRTVRGKRHLYPEEALYLLCMCAATVFENGRPLSIAEALHKFFDESITYEHCVLYFHLRRSGYIVIRHRSKKYRDLAPAACSSCEILPAERACTSDAPEIPNMSSGEEIYKSPFPDECYLPILLHVEPSKKTINWSLYKGHSDQSDDDTFCRPSTDPLLLLKDQAKSWLEPKNALEEQKLLLLSPEIHDKLQETKPVVYDVYLANSGFTFTSRMNPDHHVMLIKPDEPLLTPDEIRQLQAQFSDDRPLHFACVEGDNVIFFNAQISQVADLNNTVSE
ncbi:tRNA-splicing endonuclease subunit Sen54 [Trichinella pseudospiralis]|uniref:tRNA-splicing endonuclease subunit Sen54 n=1 Tax=Trichinella pseudospiralis TaxID=6337 RepID=A0A0V1IN33_TRIPS|nr:tRNA-splicing endonuclease subunit Sen54 [Trichinella pseudospiralis]